MNSKRTLQAVTLVELLVVIGILLLVSAMAMPILARSKEGAHKTACILNLKQLGTSLSIYRSEYEGSDHGSSSDMGLPIGRAYANWRGSLESLKCNGLEPKGSNTPNLQSYFQTWPDTTIDIYPPGIIDAWPPFVDQLGVATPLLIDLNHQDSYPVTNYSTNRVIYLRLDSGVVSKRGLGTYYNFTWFLN